MYLYFKPSADWKTAGAVFFAHTWDAAQQATQVQFTTEVESGIYRSNIEVADNFTGMVLVRMAPGSTAINWDNNWNKSNDITRSGNGNLYTAPAGWNGHGGSWSTYTDPTLQPEPEPDPEATHSFSILGTNLNGEALEFNIEGAEDLSAVVEGTELTVTISNLSDAPEGYHSVVNGVPTSYSSESHSFTVKVMSNLEYTITQTKVINDGLYLFGSMMSLEPGDGGWKAEALTPEWKLADAGTDEGVYSQWSIVIYKDKAPQLAGGEEVKVVYVKDGSIETYKTWGPEKRPDGQTNLHGGDLVVSFTTNDRNLITPTISRESTFYISDHTDEYGNEAWKIWIAESDITTTPKLTTDFEEVHFVGEEPGVTYGETFTCEIQSVEGTTINYSAFRLYYGKTEYKHDSEYVTKNEGGSYTITIPSVEKDISIKAEALLSSGIYLFYTTRENNPDRNYIKLADGTLSDSEIAYDFDFSTCGKTVPQGDTVCFKILEASGVNEENNKTWYDIEQRYDNEGNPRNDIYGSVMTGSVYNNKGTYGSDIGIKYNPSYPVYRIYFTKVGNNLGSYWITQTNKISFDLTNVARLELDGENILDQASQTITAYLWKDYVIELEFAANIMADPAPEVSAGNFLPEIDELVYTINYTKDDINQNIYDVSARPDLKVVAKASIGGENTYSLQDENGWFRDFEKYIEDGVDKWKLEGYELVTGKQYQIEWNNDNVPCTIREFRKHTSDQSFSGIAVGDEDRDAYLNFVKLEDSGSYSKCLFSLDERLVSPKVNIYISKVNNDLRLWIRISPTSVEQKNITLNILEQPQDKEVTAGLKNTNNIWGMHTYKYLDASADIYVSAGYGISSATYNGSPLTIESGSIAKFSQTNVLTDMAIDLDVEQHEDAKGIILYDGDTSKTTMLYPRTSMAQVVTPVGNTLESIIEGLTRRIAELESKINN